MSDTVRDVLIRARERISVPERWTQGAVARDINGSDVMTHSKRAVCWCSMGAIKAEAGELQYRAALNFLTGIQGECVHEYNDTHTHTEVLAMFDKAIEEAEA